MSNNINADWILGGKSQSQLDAVGKWLFNRSVNVGKIWLRVSEGGSATVQFQDRTGGVIGDLMTVTISAATGVYVTADGGKDTAFFFFGDLIANVTALSAGAVLFAEVHS